MKYVLLFALIVVTIGLIGCDEPKVASNGSTITRDVTNPGVKGDEGVGSAQAMETEFSKKHGKDWVGSKLNASGGKK